MPRLTEVQRWEEFGMRSAEMDRHLVATHFRVDPATISRLMTRVHQTGHVQDRMRTGRRRVTTVRQDRAIQLGHLRNRFLPATATAAVQIGVHGQLMSPDPVRRRLHEHALAARRPFRGPVLTKILRQRRLDCRYYSCLSQACEN